MKTEILKRLKSNTGHLTNSYEELRQITQHWSYLTDEIYELNDFEIAGFKLLAKKDKKKFDNNYINRKVLAELKKQIKKNK